MNGHTLACEAQYGSGFPDTFASVYRALAVAEAERDAQRERAIAEGFHVDDEGLDWHAEAAMEQMEPG